MNPASEITDRAKRYRANQTIAEDLPKICIFCGSTRDLQVEHLDGFEEHNEPENLAWACRSCNQLKSAVFKAAGMGRRTVQFNPGIFSRLFAPKETYRVHGAAHPEARAERAREARETRDTLKRELLETRKAEIAERREEMARTPKSVGRYKGFTLYKRGLSDDPADSRRYYSTFDPDSWLETPSQAKKLIDTFKNPAGSYATWSHAVGVLRGELEGSPFRAMRVVRSTPPGRRAAYAASGVKSNPGAHTLGAWVNALMIAKGDAPGDRKAAQDLIHETPKSRRAEFQREVWAIRKDRYGPSGRQGSFFEEVPF